MAGEVLAIADSAYGEGTGWRKRQDLIDALPYIDDTPPELRKQVELLINQEMERSTKRPQDYLKDIPGPGPMFKDRPLLQAEYERVKQRMPMPALDTTRYRLDPPPQSKRNDFNAWRSAVDNAHAQLEHQHLRIVNLELMLKHGGSVWRAQNQLTEVANKQLQAQLQQLKLQTEKVNQERKLQQVTAGSQLESLHNEWMELVHKNAAIERACLQVEGQIERLGQELEDRAPQPQPQETGAETNGNGTAVAAATEGVHEPAANGVAVEAQSNGGAAPNGDVAADSGEGAAEGASAPASSA